jgi:DNA-binding FadR family transcriptional regulator
MIIMQELFAVGEERPTTVDVVVNRIKHLLIEQKIAPSEMIPSEQALAEGLKVSRGSVREAMKILSAFGIVDIRRGDGTYISTASNKRLFDPLLFQILVQDRDYHSLIEIRQILEEGIVRLLVQKASDDELAELGRTLAEFEQLLKNRRSSAGDCDALDLKYHQLMGKYSHNTLLDSIYNFIIELFSPTINSKQPGVIEIHRDLHSALVSHDEEGAVKAIWEHTRIWVECNLVKDTEWR